VDIYPFLHFTIVLLLGTHTPRKLMVPVPLLHPMATSQSGQTALSPLLLPLFHALIQAHRKLTPLPDLWTFPIDDVDRNGDNNGEASEDGGCVFEWATGDIGVEWGGVQGSDTGEEVTGEVITAGGRSGVGAIGGSLVIDTRLIDGVLEWAIRLGVEWEGTGNFTFAIPTMQEKIMVAIQGIP